VLHPSTQRQHQQQPQLHPAAWSLRGHRRVLHNDMFITPVIDYAESNDSIVSIEQRTLTPETDSNAD